jgi:tetratricopeptide (TPR) repeat protein
LARELRVRAQLAELLEASSGTIRPPSPVLRLRGSPPTRADGATAIPCERGFVYSKTRQGCVRVSAGLIDDKELYEQGRALALAGHYANALDALRAMRDQSNAMALTMIGYAERKLGNTAEALNAYEKALAIDPDNTDAHEYLAEAYISMGRIDLAGHELEAIARICGKACEQYRDLAAAIAGAPDRSP